MADPVNGLNRADQQTVAIIDQETGQAIITELSITRLSPYSQSTMTRYTVEDGTERSDHIVKLLDDVYMDCIIDRNQIEVYEALRNIFDNNTIVTIQGKLRSYDNMILVSMPHDETGSTAFVVPLQFQEFKTTEPEYGELPPRQVSNQAHSSTVNRGQQRGRVVSSDTVTTEEGAATKEKAKQSTLSKWLKS